MTINDPSIMGLQVVGDHVAILDVGGERDGQGEGMVAVTAQAVTGDRQSRDVLQAQGDDLVDGGGEELVAIQVQDA